MRLHLTAARAFRSAVQKNYNIVFALHPHSRRQEVRRGVSLFVTMPTSDIYGFAHEDMNAARAAVERALSARLEEHPESDFPGCYYRVEIPSGPCVQIRRNSPPFIRWQGDPSNRWHPGYGLLVFVHGTAPESVAQYLRTVPGLSFLEHKETM